MKREKQLNPIEIERDLWDRLEQTKYRLQGLAAIIEERSYGLDALGIATDGFDMDADNLIASILREEAKVIDSIMDHGAKSRE